MKVVVTRGKPEYSIDVIKSDKDRALMQVSGNVTCPNGQEPSIFVTGCMDSTVYVEGEHFDVFIETDGSDPVVDISTPSAQFEVRLKIYETKSSGKKENYLASALKGGGLGALFNKNQRNLMMSTLNNMNDNEVYDIRYAYQRYRKSKPALRLSDYQEEMKKLPYKPRISIIMAVHNTQQQWLDKCIDSIKAQIYTNWELCIADDGSTDPYIPEYLKWLQNNDARVKTAYDAGSGRGVRACNAALEMATGEYVVKIDPEDMIRADAIYQIVKVLNDRPDVDLVYSDEDQIDGKDKTTYPDFKSGWAPELLYSQNYIGNLAAFRKSIIDEIGGYRIGFEKAYEYDLVLRFTERTDIVYHIPEVLYSKRVLGNYNDYAEEKRKSLSTSGVNALSSSLQRRGIDAKADFDLKLNMCTVDIKPLPETTKFTVLTYGSGNPSVKFPKNAQVIGIKNASCSEINKVFSSVNGEYIIIWDKSVELSSFEDFLKMAAWAAQPGVGSVGPKLFDNDVCYSAGLALSYNRVRSNIGHGEFNTDGYKGKYSALTDVSAVSSKCIVMSRKAFETVTPLPDEIAHYTGVEIGLRLMQAGYRSISAPIKAQMKAPMGQPESSEEIRFMQSKWNGALADKYYSDVFEVGGNYRIKMK